jgi:hypothetical protein
MQTRTNRAQRAQLELFRPQSATIDWHQLPREIQQKTRTLFARLLCEHSPIPARRSVIKESSHE